MGSGWSTFSSYISDTIYMICIPIIPFPSQALGLCWFSNRKRWGYCHNYFMASDHFDFWCYPSDKNYALFPVATRNNETTIDLTGFTADLTLKVCLLVLIVSFIKEVFVSSECEPAACIKLKVVPMRPMSKPYSTSLAAGAVHTIPTKNCQVQSLQVGFACLRGLVSFTV